jgi:hypothetical protein
VDQGIAWDGSAWVPVDLAAVAPDAVSSVNGQTGVVALTAADVGAQPSDADLTAIAALSTTSFGRGLLALADAAAGRTALGLGSAATSDSSAFQAADSDLTAIAALTTTSYGRAFLALADAAAARTALALGTAATAATGDFQAADADLTAIAALTTTTFGRSLLTQADAAAVRTAIGAAASGGSSSASSVTFTPAGTISATDVQAAIAEAASEAAQKSANLSDLASAATARTNLGVAAALIPTAVKTSNYTAAVGDLVLVDTTSGAVTITLPAAATASSVGVKLVTLGGSNAVTINCAGSDVFNKAGGATSGTLTLLNQGFVLSGKAGVWVVEADDLPLSQLDLRYAGIAGVGSAVYGTGDDGNVTVSTSVTLTRDMHYANLTITSGGTIKTDGYRVFVKGTYSGQAGAIFHNDGSDAAINVAGTGGSSASNQRVLGRGGSGASNGTATTGTAAPSTITLNTTALGGSGGAGGAGSGGAGGAGYSTAANSWSNLVNGQSWRDFPIRVLGSSFNQVNDTVNSLMISGGGGGGSGGGNGTDANNGGGGGGGGVVVLVARYVVNAGRISANGGAGGTSLTGTNNGGGGGGGGGVLLITCETYTNTGTVSASGGAGGAGKGTGSNGTAGSAGTVNVLQSSTSGATTP